MRYTNRKLIEICEGAKNLLWDGNTGNHGTGKSKFVCHALNRATEELYGEGSPDKLRKLVKAHIGGYYTMESFLRSKLGESKVSNAAQWRIQEWRFLMLDNMIKILKEKA